MKFIDKNGGENMARYEPFFPKNNDMSSLSKAKNAKHDGGSCSCDDLCCIGHHAKTNKKSVGGFLGQ